MVGFCVHGHIYVTVHTKRYHKSKNVFSDYARFRIYRSVRVFATTLGHIARLRCWDTAIFSPGTAKVTISKTIIFVCEQFFRIRIRYMLRVFWPTPPQLCSDRTMSDEADREVSLENRIAVVQLVSIRVEPYIFRIIFRITRPFTTRSSDMAVF